MTNIKSSKSVIFIILFLLPAALVYLVFQILPILGACFFSVMSWNGIAGSKLEFVGLSNYINAFNNSGFLISLQNMVKMVLISVLFHTPIALLLAVVLNSRFRGFRFFKALFFMPTVFPLTAVGLMWYFVFMPTGALNSLLGMLGFDDLIKIWLVDKTTAMNAIIFVNIWAGIGYFMVILLAGLTTIPCELYEAAKVDGASVIQGFFHITVPMLKSTIAMCILMDIIGSIKVFDLVFAMTGGGPNGLTNLPTTLLYNEAFKYSHYGLGSAIGIIIMLICLMTTTISSSLINGKKEV